MKINSISAGGMIERYQAKNVEHLSDIGQNAVADRVELSGDGLSFTSILNKAKEELNVETPQEKARVASVAERIEKGEYEINSIDIAGKILGEDIDTQV